jgi:hypothetical protein
MTETLLSPSNVLLFGRRVEDLKIIDPKLAFIKVRAATIATDGASGDGNIKLTGTSETIDGITVVPKDRVLVKDQTNTKNNGVYIVREKDWERDSRLSEETDEGGKLFVKVRRGYGSNSDSIWKLDPIPKVGLDPLTFTTVTAANAVDSRHGPFTEPRSGILGDVETQLTVDEGGDFQSPCFARVYGFSFEGTYYELPRPALFLVHGDGYPATEARTGVRGIVRAARGLGSPSLTGLAAADFQFAEDLRVWSYDKADYTIRMDVESGMFEDVLLPMIDGGGPGVGGARVSGARVSGARVSGARVSGARVSGARLSGSSD